MKKIPRPTAATATAAEPAQKPASTPGQAEEAALPDVARVACGEGAPDVTTPTVRPQADGLHVEFVNDTGKDLAFSILVLGIACWVNSVWLLGTLAAAVSIMSLVVIPREERYLERRFQAEYLEYKAKVRRWF